MEGLTCPDPPFWAGRLRLFTQPRFLAPDGEPPSFLVFGALPWPLVRPVIRSHAGTFFFGVSFLSA